MSGERINNLVDFLGYINKLDAKASQVDMTKPNSIMPQSSDRSVSERLKMFFDIADGNPSNNSIWKDD